MRAARVPSLLENFFRKALFKELCAMREMIIVPIKMSKKRNISNIVTSAPDSVNTFVSTMRWENLRKSSIEHQPLLLIE